MAETNLSKLEQDLLRVPGVRSARVVGTDVPSEIHIVTTSKRSPKQVVRDVQSLAAAGFGMPIDHRIVSVVQLDDPPPAPPEEPAVADAPEAVLQPGSANGSPSDVTEVDLTLEETSNGNGHVDGHRLVLDRVVLASKGDAGWVKVGLKWPDGHVTEGAGIAGATRDARARGASNALLHALTPVLDAMDAKIDVDHLVISRVGPNDSVLVRAMFYERGAATPLVGSALVHDDVASAAVRAILQAVNRKLRLP
ncbi:MAG: hypothetical protein M3198_08140 [Actinomycetota bacterium]|nr:hypothetical protein [Actinomycetota bacterium]